MNQLHARSARTIHDLLAETVGRDPDRIAVEDGDRRQTYGELAGRVSRLGAAFRRLAGEPGTRIGILAPNSSLYLESYFAAAWAGMVLVPLNTRAHEEGLARVLKHAGARRLIVHDSLATLGRAVSARAGIPCLPDEELAEPSARVSAPLGSPARLSPEDPAHIYYTSGTTGDPKGVVLTHRNVCHHAAMACRALELDDADVFAHVAPMFHLADAWAAFSITQVGGRHRMVGAFQAAAVLDELSRGVTLTNLVPTMLGDLVFHPQARRPYPALRRILSGGAPIAPALVERILATFGCEYVQTYGLTETAPFLTMSLLPPHLEARPAEERLRYRCKTGRPLPGVEVRVVDSGGRPVPANGQSVGEIVARGPSVTPGYWHNPVATAAAFRDGWFHTGDLAVVDEEGFLNIVDRKKDVILSGGETLYSTEIEKVLAAHPAIRECAVVGVPHERWGEAVLGVVVLTSAATASAATGPDRDLTEELRRHCRAHLGSHQVPKDFVFREALPRTGSGKIAKRLLRDEYGEWFWS